MYRWFLRHFPRGGSYADIHHALIEEGYTDWAESLVEYAWKKWLADENFAHQEVSSMQKTGHRPRRDTILQSVCPQRRSCSHRLL
ncbi:putative oxidoreductase subunit [Escherichia coli]|nr:putative oxidoreductase subunit [Escherichia coli]